MQKRRDNWERVAQVLNAKTMKPPLTSIDYEPVMFLAKDAAFNFVCRYFCYHKNKGFMSLSHRKI